MEQDTRLIDFLSRLIARWADLDALPAIRYGSKSILRVRDHLDAHLDEEADLADLANLAGLSRSHFIRAFAKETGLTPHAYLLDRRFRAATRLLRAGARRPAMSPPPAASSTRATSTGSSRPAWA